MNLCLISTLGYYPFGMAMPKRSLSLGNYRFGFNTQEKVDEIFGNGNHNTAIYWEYDTRLGRRWNLDPKPEANVSNYSTLANNPIWFNDMLGDKVEFKSESDRKFVEKFTSKTEVRRGFLGLGQLKERTNRSYNKNFATIVNDLDSREETYAFGENKNINSFGTHPSGLFSYDGNKFNIEYSKPPEIFGGDKDAILFEETFHAKQFTEGKVTFVRNTDGTWGSPNADLTDEIEAKKFAATAKSYSSTFNYNGVRAATQLGYIMSHADVKSMAFLRSGTAMITMGANGGRSELIYDASYPTLDAIKKDSKLSLRTFNNSEVGYPHK